MDYQKEYTKWINSPLLSDSEKAQLDKIDEIEKEERFYASLSFGTAGLRGICRVGTNGMNVYVVRHTTWALGKMLQDSRREKTAAICTDCRVDSGDFARAAAVILADMGIKVYIFEDMRPTPQLSFAIRHFDISCGINITASHNPKEYNGYKVYWRGGAQIDDEKAGEISRNMASCDIFDVCPKGTFENYIEQGNIKYFDKSLDELFIKETIACCPKGELESTDLKVAYTPLYGAGALIVPRLLREMGLKNLYCQEEQMVKDGTFPTAQSPNPENPISFEKVLETAAENGADLAIATDPDCDRIGIMVKNHEGKYEILTGNQVGLILTQYLITAHKGGEKPALVTTIVTSRLVEKICKANNVDYVESFTGFRFMAEKIEEKAIESRYILAFEEAIGYMTGSHVRDKDGASASALICECAALCMAEGKTLLDYLQDIYDKYGFSFEKTLNIEMPGKSGMSKMARLMQGLRYAPPARLGGIAVRYVKDYLKGQQLDLEKIYCDDIELKGSNVLAFILSDGNTIVIRPSGTEPKVKIYILLSNVEKSVSDILQKLESDVIRLVKEYSEDV